LETLESGSNILTGIAPEMILKSIEFVLHVWADLVIVSPPVFNNIPGMVLDS